MTHKKFQPTPVAPLLPEHTKYPISITVCQVISRFIAYIAIVSFELAILEGKWIPNSQMRLSLKLAVTMTNKSHWLINSAWASQFNNKLTVTLHMYDCMKNTYLCMYHVPSCKANLHCIRTHSFPMCSCICILCTGMQSFPCIHQYLSQNVWYEFSSDSQFLSAYPQLCAKAEFVQEGWAHSNSIA